MLFALYGDVYVYNYSDIYTNYSEIPLMATYVQPALSTAGILGRTDSLMRFVREIPHMHMATTSSAGQYIKNLIISQNNIESE